MKQFFSTSEAANYLGLAIVTIKYHIYTSKSLAGQKIGNSLVFSRKQLDEFKAKNQSSRRR